MSFQLIGSTNNPRFKNPPLSSASINWLPIITFVSVCCAAGLVGYSAIVKFKPSSSSTNVDTDLPPILSSSSSTSIHLSSSIIPSSVFSSTGVSSSVFSSSSAPISSSASVSSSSSVVNSVYSFSGPVPVVLSYDTILRQSKSRLVRIAWMGDSVGAGDFASNLFPSPRGTGMVQVLQTSLQAKYGDGGSGFLNGFQALIGAANQAGCYSQANLPVNFNGFGWTSTSSLCAPGSTSFTCSTNNAVITFYARGSMIQIIYATGVAGTIVVSINGTSYGTITVPGGAYNVLQSSYFVPSGEWSVALTVSSNVPIAGVGGYYANGIVIDNYSIPGMSLGTLTTCTGPLNAMALSGGGYFNKADLVVGALGLNDQESASQFITYYTTVFNAYSGSSIIIILPNAGVVSGYSYGASVATYGPPAISLGSTYSGYTLDLNKQATINSFAGLVALGFYPNFQSGGSAYTCGIPGVPQFIPSLANVVHPSDIGHGLMANALLPYFMGCNDPRSQSGCAPVVVTGNAAYSSSSSIAVPISSSSSTGVAALSSVAASVTSSSSSVVAAPVPILNMSLSNLFDSANGKTAALFLSTWPTNCAPTFPSTTLPNGKVGNAYLNPCSTDFNHIVTTVAYTNDFTMMIWVRRASAITTDVIMCSTSIANLGTWTPSNSLIPTIFTESSPGGSKGNFLNNPTTSAFAPTTIQGGYWTHIAATFVSATGTWQLYLNGTANGAAGSVTTTWTTFTKPFVQIGGTNTTGGHQLPFVGSLSSALVFASVLTPTQINVIYAAGLV